ncbi:hypothetical protein DL769_004835 [Monosporascus sp. CRB-8-3]|nr:hypothetical protein DL769_004835 [Monosporascus sp. CRB-8-3]
MTTTSTTRRYYAREPSVARNGETWWHRGRMAALFAMLENLRAGDPGCAATLASRVRSLCTALDELYDSCFSLKTEDSGELAPGWALFPLLGKLERLESQSEPDPFENARGEGFDAAAAPPLSRLRSVRLFGYLPANIVRYILRSAAALERLGLGALDEPLVPGDVSDERVCDDDNSDFWGGADADPVAQQYAPPPLVPDPGETPADYDDVIYSRRAMEGSLREWVRLLESARATVETLVLEYHVLAEDGELDSRTPYEFTMCYSSGSAEDRLIKAILSVFEQNGFPNPRKAHPYGMFVDGQVSEKLSAIRRGRGVQRKINVGSWCRFDAHPGVTDWMEE